MEAYGKIRVPKSLRTDIASLLDYSENYTGESYEEVNASIEKFVKANDIPRNLYVIRCDGTNYYKIGIANDVVSRLRNHQTGCPFKLKEIFHVESDLGDYQAREIVYLEKFLHRCFKKQKVRGEWFELTHEDLSDIIQFLECDRELEVFHNSPAELNAHEKRIELQLQKDGW
ncbi:GIY-YIG nuclease family protein [Alteromonas gracilis]|uniref:GIY-YIG nuclease family protein n=1 Tax=Alteromonas gracilis TaxID=1479524 RepID=UPI003735433A